MRTFKYFILSVLVLGVLVPLSATKPKDPVQSAGNGGAAPSNTVSYRADCAQGTSSIDMDINNVRARLLSSGDVWWDLSDAKYIVPNVEPGSGLPEVSSVYAGSVWLGGVDPAGNLKVAAQTYRSSTSTDFWPGPLDPIEGTVDEQTCENWDKHFVVLGSDIRNHLSLYREAVENGVPYDESLIPESVKGWPARGNRFFQQLHDFDLPDTEQGLALFYDTNGNELYEPELGDYPVIDIRGCDLKEFPDQMIFWIYNDAGGIHTATQGNAIQMEVQVQAFGYQTNDELNDMTFQRYKLINRAVEDIDSTFFAMWVDADLGCYTDDYVGCDTARSLAYYYNQDALDGTSGCTCDGGAPTYCDRIPLLGIDYFRGPRDPDSLTLNPNTGLLEPTELGMSSFTYYCNSGVGQWPAAMEDPGNFVEYYNYLTGSWRDGTPFTFGGSAYNPGSTDVLKYSFVSPPNDATAWSMSTANLGEADRRTIQASGPFRLEPGAVNELIIGLPWVPDQDHPAPSISELQFADDLAQALFDNCFDITDGPDAPDMTFVEMDREVIIALSNSTDSTESNNFYERYSEIDLQAPPLLPEEEKLYRFEGYKVYQFVGPNVSVGDLDDPSKARLVFQVDIANDATTIYNWKSIDDPNSSEVIWVPEVQVEGKNAGVNHVFRVKEDQFAPSDRRLVNHKKYYFTTIAYAYNNYESFSPTTGTGQRKSYLEGRRNIGDAVGDYYTVIPRPITDRALTASFGDGVEITRHEGAGVNQVFLDMTDEMRNSLISPEFNGDITYLKGQGPINIQIFNPIDAKSGHFLLSFVDPDNTYTLGEVNYDTRWVLKNIDTNEEIYSERSIERINEQLIASHGFMISIGQPLEPGTDSKNIANNGAIGSALVFKDTSKQWLGGIPDGQFFFDYIRTEGGAADNLLDYNQALTNMSDLFKPYYLTRWDPPAESPALFTPCWQNGKSNIVRDPSENGLYKLNNVDIVLTSDKSKWSRCIVVETSAPYMYETLGLPTAAGDDYDPGTSSDTNFNPNNFDVRRNFSVGKEDADGDGLPDRDNATDPLDDNLPLTGMGWFPGYAVDVETGQRLNIFFGENSSYNGNDDAQSAFFTDFEGDKLRGRDMMWNPSSTNFLNSGIDQVYDLFLGGQQYIYVTNEVYDSCKVLRDKLDPRIAGTSEFKKISGLRDVTWACMPVITEGQEMLSYKDGLIPNETIIKLRVDNPYVTAAGNGEYSGYPTYEFRLEGVESVPYLADAVKNPLDLVNVVPNPYYGYSEYETSQFTTTVKFTNLPAKCTVTIYTLDGKFIKQYDRDESRLFDNRTNVGVEYYDILPDLEWDIKNFKGIPVASGVYLIHIDGGELGERVIKWFGVNRPFDPSGL
jgi:hypothetical protein